MPAMSEDMAVFFFFAGSGGTAVRTGRVIAVVVSLFVAVGVAFAAADTLNVAGKVKSLDLEAGTLVVTVQKEGAEPTDMTFVVKKDTTKVVAGEEASNLEALKPGLRVAVAYTAEGETLTASLIQIVVREPRKAPAAE